MLCLESVLQAEGELNEDLGFGDQLLEALPHVGWWAKQELARELNDLNDLGGGHSQSLELSEVARLDLLQSLKDSLFLAHALLIQRLISLDALGAGLLRRRVAEVRATFLALLGLAFLFEGLVLRLELCLFLCPLLLTLLDTLHDLGKFRFFDGDLFVASVNLFSICTSQRPVRYFSELRPVPILAIVFVILRLRIIVLGGAGATHTRLFDR